MQIVPSGPSTYYEIHFTVKRFRRLTCFLVNQVEYQKLNKSCCLVEFLVLNLTSANTV